MQTIKWLKLFFSLSFVLLSIFALFNYAMDPLWTFSHSHTFNNVQSGFNERQQKTNYVYFNKLKEYNGLILGSSRTTFVNQHSFRAMNLYNYACSSMVVSEYNKYINFAKQAKEQDFQTIIIGLDFFNTNKKYRYYSEKPEYYINNTTQPFYRYKMLFSLDVYNHSMRNLKYQKRGAETFYTRDNIKFQKKITEEQRRQRYAVNLARHTDDFIDKNYIYDSTYKDKLATIVKQNPNTHFIFFTSPITANLLSSILINAKRFDEYERWLKETIKIAGEIHHFMDINSITTNLENYPDDDHFYPYIGDLIANRILNHPDSHLPNDFGITLNEKNIDAYLKNLKSTLSNYPVPVISNK
jgi:hypothetical protein